MVIGETKVKKDQNISELDECYFETIKSITYKSLSELKFVKLVSYQRSKSTDSIYFTFSMNHHDQVFTLSLRTHPPKECRDNYFYVFLYDYDNLGELKATIQDQLIAQNKKMNKKKLNAYAHSPHNHRTTKKKKRKNQKKLCNLCFNTSFHQLMNEVNNRNQLDTEEECHDKCTTKGI